ncbi:hypothetical protein AB4264_24105 [Vibrio sp. 10N.261.55.B8]|uniref:hypothetical protein n=1 Tax=unclassified Vibrio TaxID=2614977 RepID=UPI00354B7887
MNRELNDSQQATLSFFYHLFLEKFDSPQHYNTYDGFIAELKQSGSFQAALSQALTASANDLTVFIDETCYREMSDEIHSRLMQLQKPVILTLYKESLIRRSYKLCMINAVYEQRDLTKIEKNDVKQLLIRINEKPHVLELFEMCVKIVEELVEFKRKVKKIKLKGKKPK